LRSSFPKPNGLDRRRPPHHAEATFGQKVRPAYLTGMKERLARIERDIAKALNAGDHARVRRLSKQWSRLWLLDWVKARG
jgi:hypothetical protein